MNQTNQNYVRPSWDEYFLEVMNAISKRATCGRGRSGCVIAKANRLLVSGYVGSPTGLPHCDDIGHQMKKMLHEDGNTSEHCVRTVHAEINAIAQCARQGKSCDGGIMYVTYVPCEPCAKLMLQSGIKKVYANQIRYEEGYNVLKQAKVEVLNWSEQEFSLETPKT